MNKFQHLLLYIFLFAGLATAGGLLVFFTGRQRYQLFVVVAASGFYIFWGALHHILEGEFDGEVLLDYLLLSVLVVVVFLLAVRL